MKVFAKLNLFLNVFEEYNGFHELESVFSPCFDIYDEVEIRVCDSSEAGVFFSVCDFVKLQGEEYFEAYSKKVAGLADIKDNAKRAVEIFSEKYNLPPICVKIAKGIPFLGGMGGSSADAVGVLKLLCEMFHVMECDGISLANRIGSDLAGMWSGGVNFCKGRGDIAVEIAKEIGGYAVVCTPNFGVSTKEVFKAFDSFENMGIEFFPHAKLCVSGDFDYIKDFACLSNALERSTFAVSSEAKEFSKTLSELSDVRFLMTGSGSGFFTLTKTKAEAEGILAKVENACDFAVITRV